MGAFAKVKQDDQNKSLAMGALSKVKCDDRKPSLTKGKRDDRNPSLAMGAFSKLKHVDGKTPERLRKIYGEVSCYIVRSVIRIEIL